MMTGKKPETRLKGAFGLMGAGGKLLGIPGSAQASQTARDFLRKPETDILKKHGIKIKSEANSILEKYGIVQ